MLRRPDESRPVGDVIPFFDEIDHLWHLFYLSPLQDQDSLEARLAGVQWEHVSSPDLITWTRHPAALLADSPGIDTGGALTGCVVRGHDRWFLFYSANDPDAQWPQTINLATSTDLITFQKSAANPILVPFEPSFESSDWRDPFVFWNNDESEYWMLISARQSVGPSARRGAIAVATSPDLEHWTPRIEPLLAPGLTLVPECADLMRFGTEWVLGFSAYTGPPGIQFFSAMSLDGPWAPKSNFTDGGAWYAGKSMWDGERHLAFAWIPDRAARSDRGRMLWGGDFATPRELWMDEAGSLGHRLPAEILETFSENVSFGTDVTYAATSAEFQVQPIIHSPGAGAMFITFTIDWRSADGSAGLLVRAPSDLDSGLMLSISPTTRRVELFELSDNWTHMVELPYGPWVAHTDLRDLGPSTLVQAIVDGSCVEIFVDKRMSLSHRYYGDPQAPLFTLFSQHARVGFSRVSLKREGSRARDASSTRALQGSES